MDTSLRTDLAHSPPQRFVAAGQTAISAYYIRRKSSAGGQTVFQGSTSMVNYTTNVG